MNKGITKKQRDNINLTLIKRINVKRFAELTDEEIENKAKIYSISNDYQILKDVLDNWLLKDKLLFFASYDELEKKKDIA